MRQKIHQLASDIDNNIMTSVIIISVAIVPLLVAIFTTIVTNRFQALLVAISLSILLIICILGIIICAVDRTYKD